MQQNDHHTLAAVYLLYLPLILHSRQQSTSTIFPWFHYLLGVCGICTSNDCRFLLVLSLDTTITYPYPCRVNVSRKALLLLFRQSRMQHLLRSKVWTANLDNIFSVYWVTSLVLEKNLNLNLVRGKDNCESKLHTFIQNHLLIRYRK